jgi:hypothetical protein
MGGTVVIEAADWQALTDEVEDRLGERGNALIARRMLTEAYRAGTMVIAQRGAPWVTLSLVDDSAFWELAQQAEAVLYADQEAEAAMLASYERAQGVE